MRVIAGTARGAALFAPEGDATRPTADRLKENLFNILQVRGSSFLDLFSGSGAIGIEALSRGARSAVFVEKSRKASDVIKRNLVKTRLSDKAEVFVMSVRQAVETFSASGLSFDNIFMDPPYESDYIAETIALAEKFGILFPGGTLSAEMPAGKLLPEHLGFKVKMIKTYGDKKFAFLTTEDSPVFSVISHSL